MSGSESLPDFATPDLCDEHGDLVSVLDYQFRSFGTQIKFSGPVSTVACFEDNSRVAEAAAEQGEGRVLLVDGQGSLARSLLGDRLASLAADNGWAGIVIVGAVRDVEVIDTIDIGVQALGVCPRKTDKRGRGDRDVQLSLRETEISPGCWLYADRNGVVISAKALG